MGTVGGVVTLFVGMTVAIILFSNIVTPIVTEAQSNTTSGNVTTSFSSFLSSENFSTIFALIIPLVIILPLLMIVRGLGRDDEDDSKFVSIEHSRRSGQKYEPNVARIHRKKEAV